MELQLIRHYQHKGTNGDLYIGRTLVCHTIECPRVLFDPLNSCLPEGRYRLVRTWNQRHGDHFRIQGPKGIRTIRMHAASDPAERLMGHISPVLWHTGPGMGACSNLAMKGLVRLVDELCGDEPSLWLVIRADVSRRTSDIGGFQNADYRLQ